MQWSNKKRLFTLLLATLVVGTVISRFVGVERHKTYRMRRIRLSENPFAREHDVDMGVRAALRAAVSNPIQLTFLEYPNATMTVYSDDFTKVVESLRTDQLSLTFSITLDFGRVRASHPIMVNGTVPWDPLWDYSIEVTSNDDPFAPEK